MLAVRQVDRQRCHVRAVAGGGSRVLGEIRGGAVTTRAAQRLSAVLGDPQPHLGKVEHLPAALPDRRRRVQAGAAGAAAPRCMLHDPVRPLDAGQVQK